MKIPNVSELIKPPAGEELVLVAHAKGFQIYVCQAGAAGEPTWVLKAPEAFLYNDQGDVLGKHFGGPTWKHSDGSEITAKLAEKVDSPDASAIPWLLLTVTDHSGNGVFSRIISIQRIHTVGGLAPTSGCSSENLEKESKSSYTADYYFYARK
ncbi:MAG TPA: DUF3455 domain-containing protein [Candidatus Angelobacter sp.]|nr:DUF3455 domain-containing protein [Candidatus Angelobacter sp.]